MQQSRFTILPLLAYSSSLHLTLTKIQLSKLKFIERRAKTIIQSDYEPSIESFIKFNVYLLVKKFLAEVTCENLTNYFKINVSQGTTKNSSKLLPIPAVKLEFERKTFYL